MPAKRLVPLVVAGAIVAVLWLAAVAQAVPNRMIALGAVTNKNTLYAFSGNDLNTVTVVPVTGLGGATLVGISFRPSNGLLYGVGITGNTTSVFTIDPIGGAAALVGSASPGTISGTTSYGIDFNPVPDRIRVVDGLPSTDPKNINNFRLNPNNGTLSANDQQLDYNLLPGGEAGNLPLATIAYDRNVAGATVSTLFGITAGAENSLVRLGGIDGLPIPGGSPNGGKLTFIGALGVDTSSNAGLDIDPATGEAYAILQVGGASGLYRIDLVTGAATLIGKVAGGVISFGSLAIVPPPPPPLPPEPTPSAPAPSAPLAVAELQALTIKPFGFLPAPSGGPITVNRRLPGTKVSYTLSVAATVTFSVEKAIPGKRGKFRTLKSTFAHPGATGANGFRFTGRLKGNALAPGRYRLRASVGSSSRTAGFKIRLR